MDSSTVKDIVRRHWARRAADFDSTASHGLLSSEQRWAWADFLERWVGVSALDVVDIGCGTGFLALQLAELGHRVWALDSTEEMLALARSKAAQHGLEVQFQQGDAEHPPFGDAAFDLVVERHVIWTLPDPLRALGEWRRVLRPGGRVLLIEGDWRRDGSPRTDEYADIQHSLPLYGGRPATVLRDLLEEAGFVALAIEPLAAPALWGSAPDRERYALLGTKS